MALGDSWVPGHANFWTAAGWKFGTYQQIWTKSHGICGHETISVAFQLLNIIHMGLMSDAAEW
jgi:hypothetical protein